MSTISPFDRYNRYILNPFSKLVITYMIGREVLYSNNKLNNYGMSILAKKISWQALTMSLIFVELYITYNTIYNIQSVSHDIYLYDTLLLWDNYINILFLITYCFIAIYNIRKTHY